MGLFRGFSPETYDFLTEIAWNNYSIWFEENRARYVRCVKEPMYALAAALLPSALEVDPAFNPRIASIVSRIRRDTRYSKDKSPYRAHAWLCFKHHATRVSENFAVYFEITPTSYGYGMGMYSPNPAIMGEFRKRLIARPALFLKLKDSAKLSMFGFEGESYKRDRHPDAPDNIKEYLNLRSIGWHFSSDKLLNTMEPELFNEVNAAFLNMKDMYRFITGADGMGESK